MAAVFLFVCFRNVCWEQHFESSSLTGFAAYSDFSPMIIHDLFAKRQPDARTAVVACKAPEWLESLVGIFLLKSDAVV